MKWHKIVDDAGAKELVEQFFLLEAAEDAWIETGSDYITLDPSSRTVYIPYGNERIIETIPSLSQKYSSKHIYFREGEGEIHYRDFYTILRDISIEKLSPFIKSILDRTRSYGLEHALLLLEDGKIFLLEGEREHVTLPEIRCFIFIHTHPSPLCLPSKQDIRQAATFFMNNGFLNAIASSQCLFIMYRRWLLGEEDILTLKDLESRINSFYKRSRDPLVEIGNMLRHTYIGVSISLL
jgi:hypothetical protein